ncbi:MAG: RMD1 family protein [Cyanobacteria bacterium]|nr:RMD1 family protein [Cyanobacteriota bacterium]MDA0867459.1 RMD1 family protein [Cyanobacteriota bacterium]MEB3268643.1 RMD1 family protein [Leptolyngbya sp.]
MSTLFADQDSIKVRAYFLGQQIDLQPFSCADPLAVEPLVVSSGEKGCAVLFDYGAAVLFGLSAIEEAKFLSDIQGLIVDPFSSPETEDAVIRRAPGQAGRVESDRIDVAKFDLPSLQLVAEVLAKSVVLAEYESGAAQVFDQVEPFAISLQSRKFRRGRAADLLKQIGNSLMIQHKIVGRVEIVDKPELLWEYPELDRLYARLEDEYEIRERHQALERKLDLVSRTAETALELQHQNTGLRLEWYVVILIVIEVLLSLYELFVA